MTGRKVEQYFQENNLPYEVMYAGESSATVELAAKAFKTEPETIAKTLALHGKDGDMVLVTCGTYKIDNQKFKQQFQCKAKMMGKEETPEIIGHPVGGVCPFALDSAVGIYLDVSLKSFDYVYPAGGSANSAVKIKPDELAQVTGGQWVDVCAPMAPKLS